MHSFFAQFMTLETANLIYETIYSLLIKNNANFHSLSSKGKTTVQQILSYYTVSLNVFLDRGHNFTVKLTIYQSGRGENRLKRIPSRFRQRLSDVEHRSCHKPEEGTKPRVQ